MKANALPSYSSHTGRAQNYPDQARGKMVTPFIILSEAGLNRLHDVLSIKVFTPLLFLASMKNTAV